MKHLGDITEISGYDVPIVDIVTGGSPCQDLSVAGKREGLKGERSGLFMEQIRIIKEMREHDGKFQTDGTIRPRYMVWENVPGAFSSNKGYDFKAVLEETAKIADENAVIPEPTKDKNGKLKWSTSGVIVGNGWSIAWRLHDSQWWGVPQRRKRICLLADFNGDTAGRILFELQRKTPESDTEQAIVDIGTESRSEVQSVSKGVPGNIAESREEGQRIAEDTERCAGEAGGIYDVRISSDGTKNWRAHCYETERCRALDTGGEDPNSNHGGIAVVAFEPGAMSRVGGHAYEDVAGTLDASYYKGCGERQGVERTVVYGLDRASYNQGINAKYDFSVEAEKIATQTAKGPGAVYNNYIVRRLTPLECERLQGFPTIRKVRFTEMTKDEYIAWNINEGHIVVDTEYGKVFATRGQGGIKLDEPKELMGSVVNGYRVVSIRNGNTKMQCRVHRIVWIAEHGVIPDGYVIDHINNDKQDNRLCNLQLLTPKENSTKARADGLYKIHGEAGQSKITDEVHDFIQYVYGNTDLSIRQLSEIFGISKSRVHQIIHDEAWTNIGEWVDSKGKKHKAADSPRYKALGNSIALPFWQYLADKMCAYLEDPTMASLFDGIGGFPLVFTRAGAKPIWASEIEEFPIAVTKRRFPDEVRDDD